MKNRKQTQLGFSGTEFLTIVVIATILLAIVSTIALNIAYQEKYKVMRYNAVLFGYNASSSILGSDTDKVFLQTLIQKQLFVNIKNPFGKEKYCDPYRSYVEFVGDTKYITLNCGSYLIDHQNMLEKEIPIYKVSDWTTQNNSESMEHCVLYNYQSNNQDVLEKYYEADAFLFIFNQREHTSYQNVQQIPSDYHVIEKDFYRTKTLVQTVDND